MRLADRRLLTALVASIFLVSHSAQAAPGDLDLTFGGTGTVTTETAASAEALSVAIQADGKIVAVGNSSDGGGPAFAVARYDSFGALDPSFGGTGWITTQVSPAGQSADSVAIQADGKILVAGSAVGTDYDFAIVRYDADGALDASFGGTGIVTTPIGTSTSDAIFSIAVQSDGKIVAVGQSGSSGWSIALARYNPDGTLDASFGGGTGKVTTTIGAISDRATSVALQADGRIVVTGTSYVDGSDENVVVARYEADGALDGSFGTGAGFVITEIGSFGDFARSVAVQSDGRIVVAGSTQRSASFLDVDVMMVRYDASGALDASFGGTGKVITPIGPTYDEALSMAIQMDGKIVVAGRTFDDTFEIAVLRYKQDGVLDGFFGSSGMVVTPIGTSGQANSVAIQSDGKIVTAGRSVDGDWHFGLARYEGGGPTGDYTKTPVLLLYTTEPWTSYLQSIGYPPEFLRTQGLHDFSTTSPDAATHQVAPAVDAFLADVNAFLAAEGWGGPPKTKVAILAFSRGGQSARWYAAQLSPEKVERLITVAGPLHGTNVACSLSGALPDELCPAFSSDPMEATQLTLNGLPAADVDETPYGYGADLPGVARISPDFTRAILSFSIRGESDSLVSPVTSSEIDGAGGPAVTLPPDATEISAGNYVFPGDGHAIASPDFVPFVAQLLDVEPPATVCGDALIHPGEECDDGDTLDGDCCSSDCAFEPLDSSCLDEDACNGDETCDGAGACLSGSALSCDDGDVCTQESCDPIAGCASSGEPATVCLDTWAKASLLVQESVAGKEKVIAKLQSGPQLDRGDFGDPLLAGGTAYTACLYGGTGDLAGTLEIDRAGMECAGRDCWKGVATKGYLYKDKSAAADGAQSVKLLGGDAGKSKILLKAANNSSKGQSNLPTGIAAALSGSGGATIQLHGSDAANCFSATLGTVVKDSGGLFKAKR